MSGAEGLRGDFERRLAGGIEGTVGLENPRGVHLLQRARELGTLKRNLPSCLLLPEGCFRSESEVFDWTDVGVLGEEVVNLVVDDVQVLDQGQEELVARLEDLDSARLHLELRVVVIFEELVLGFLGLEVDWRGERSQTVALHSLVAETELLDSGLELVLAVDVPAELVGRLPEGDLVVVALVAGQVTNSFLERLQILLIHADCVDREYVLGSFLHSCGVWQSWNGEGATS